MASLLYGRSNRRRRGFEANGAGTVAGIHSDVRRRSRDAAWVRRVALSPLVFFGLSVPVTVVLGGSGTLVDDVVTTWTMFGAFSFVVFFTLAALSFLGAAALSTARARRGRWLASTSAVIAVLAHLSVVYLVVTEVVEPGRRDPNSWTPALTPGAAALVVLPFIVAAAANAYVLARLWRRHRVPGRDA